MERIGVWTRQTCPELAMLVLRSLGRCYLVYPSETCCVGEGEVVSVGAICHIFVSRGAGLLPGHYF